MDRIEYQLRRLIRENLLTEAESPTLRAANAGLAVVRSTWRSGSSSEVIIYSPNLLLEEIRHNASPYGGKPSHGDIKRVIRESIFGWCIVRAVVSYKPPERGRCWDSEVVSFAAASSDGHPMIPKVGPAAYEAAMWYANNHSLTPDRDLVSQSAGRVWKIYADRSLSGEVETQPFDDVDDPKTPIPDDDCILHNDDRPTLDSTYSLKSKPAGLDSLVRSHNETAETLEREYDFDEGEFVAALVKLSYQLFEAEYAG